MYVFRAGLYCAVVFVIAHTINIMGAGGEEEVVIIGDRLVF